MNVVLFVYRQDTRNASSGDTGSNPVQQTNKNKKQDARNNGEDFERFYEDEMRIYAQHTVYVLW